MICLDSCVVIYLVEKHPLFYRPLDRQFREHTSMGFAISPLAVLECLVGPLKREDATLQARFEGFFAVVAQLPNDEAVFREAAELRAHLGVKTPDALHLATAERYGCIQFWTNDDRLAKASPLAENVLRS